MSNAHMATAPAEGGAIGDTYPEGHAGMSGIVSSVWHFGSIAPERVALRGPSGELTYVQLRDGAEAVRRRIVAQGLEPGDRVLFVAPSVPEFAVVYLGLLAAGVVIVTSNTMSTQRELDYVVSDAGCSFVIAWHESAEAARAVATDRDLHFWEVLADVSDTEPAIPDGPPLSADLGGPAVILYTSGTTGQPKGAVLSHGNLLACAKIFAAAFEVRPDDRFGTALPLFHVFGQAVILGTVLNSGVSLSLLPRFDAVDMIEMMRRDNLTILVGVPTVWTAILQAADGFEPTDFDCLRLAISGGASLPSEVIRAFDERFHCTVLEGYALTETCGTGTFSGLHRARKPGSAGAALPGVEIAIRDEEGIDVGPGEIGEIYLKGPTVMVGYWGRADATAEVLRNGWLQTGDLGTVDDDGDLRVVDRRKDLIIRGGYNVYPREVEEVLYEHPDIVETAVIGVPHDYYGQEVAAVVALRPGADIDGPQLRAWLKDRISNYKVPRLYWIVDALPKGPTGKILKRALDPDEVIRESQVEARVESV